LQLAAPILVLSAINGVQSGTLAGFESFRLLTIGRILIAFLNLPLMVAGAWWGGVQGALVAIIVLAVIRFAWFRFAINRHSRQRGVIISYRGVWQEAPMLLRFALPSMLAAALYAPVVWAANAMLVQTPNGLVEMGKFNAASSWRGLIIWLPSAIGQVALPIFTSFVSSGERHRLARVVKLNLAINFLLALIVALPICLGSYWIMMLYGVEFSKSWPALVFLSGAAVFQATATVIGDVIASASRMWWGFFLNLLWAVELLISAWFFIGYGADGLAAAFFLSYMLHLIQVGCYTAYLLRFDLLMSRSP
jgi:O-antigen/teichoic acid export membrane protein